MHLHRTKVVHAFMKARNIKDHYRSYAQGGESNVLDVKNFERVVSDVYETKIVRVFVDFSGSNIRGLVERWPNEARIYIRDNLDGYWDTFTSVKEICHVMVDMPEDFSPDGTETLGKLLIEYQLQNGTMSDAPTQSEVLAEIAAIEVMYPYEDRIRDRVKVAQGDLTPMQISKHYEIPLAIVARALSDQYHEEIAEPIWSEIAMISSLVIQAKK